MIEIGKLVTIEYNLYSDGGELLDTSEGLGPLSFTCGEQQIVPALEQALIGLNSGDNIEVNLEAKDAYGEVYASAFREIDASDLPEDMRIEGAIFGIDDEQGQTRQVRVHLIKGAKAVLDFNHPLAGQNLKFEISIISIE